ncbi:MAG: LpxI family protein [bacterium]
MGSLGLIAGGGQFPILVAEEAKKKGLRVVAVGIHGITSQDLKSHVDKLCWVSLASLSKLIHNLKSEGINRAIMAGQVRHVNIFKEIRFDLRALRILRKLSNKKADSILRAVAEELEKEGIHILDSTTYLSSLIPLPGVITKRKPTKKEMIDVEFGFQIAKEIAGLDIGQTVVVKDKAVIAIEAMEGTDEAIKRGGQIGGKGTVVVKVSKPNQDMRFDVPVIGLRTLQYLKEAGASVMAIEAGKTLFFDQSAFIGQANTEKIAIISI